MRKFSTIAQQNISKNLFENSRKLTRQSIDLFEDIYSLNRRFSSFLREKIVGVHMNFDRTRALSFKKAESLDGSPVNQASPKKRRRCFSVESSEEEMFN